MKTLKILVIAFVALCAFETTNAQVVVRARIGTPPPHRVVVTRRPVYHRTVVYHPVRRAPYYRHHRREVIIRHPRRY